MFQIKDSKTPEKEPNKTETSNLPDKEFEIMVIKMLIKLKNIRTQ